MNLYDPSTPRVDNARVGNKNQQAGQNGRGDSNLKLFIGGVPRTVSDEEYREYFRSFGELDDCILMRDQDGICRGFGFVTYRDQEAYDNVMAAHLQIRGRKLEQKKAVPQRDVQQKQSEVKVFLGGLSKDVDKEKINEYFSQFGEVVDSIVMKDAMTGNSRGFGFITFSDPASVDELMNNPKFEFCGKSIQCKRAQSAASMNRMNRDRPGGRFGGGGGRGGRFGGGGDYRGIGRGNFNGCGFSREQPSLSEWPTNRNDFNLRQGGYAPRPMGDVGGYAARPMGDAYAYRSGGGRSGGRGAAGRYRPY